jgi:predicted 2-oxoglutarate/Fe(II)-dependent dioxygenase YbiX
MEIVQEAADIVSFQAFSPGFCAEISERSRDNVPWRAGRVRYGKGKAAARPATRECLECELDRLPSLRRKWDAACTASVFKIASLSWSFRLTRCDEAFLVRYGPGGGFKRHLDHIPGGRMRPRLLSVICYLNDGFTGGRTLFPRQDHAVEPRAGKVVLYPSGITHPHEVEPVRGGERLVLTAFLR